MKAESIIGIDIGGTNTDAVLVENERIVCSQKTATTDDIATGFVQVLEKLINKSQINPEQVKSICVGTTHATNAILQNQELLKVGVIRIAGHNIELPPGYSWPNELRQTVIGPSITIRGGLECCGRATFRLEPEEIKSALYTIQKKNIQSLAIVGIFSPLSGEQERELKRFAVDIFGKDFPISLSSEIGGIGFIERENSTILNAALKKVMQKGFFSLQTAARKIGFTCELMITQNDGSLLPLEKALQYPVLTISAGPTNSFIGGSRLVKQKNLIVVDIGGTSTDVGLIKNGFPMRSINRSQIGGVSLNFQMPDILSTALGGGTILTVKDERPLLTSQSVGRDLYKKSCCFGGDTLTLTDAACALGYLNITTNKFNPISLESGKAIFAEVKQRIGNLVARMRGENFSYPVVVVGGGAALLPKNFLGEDCHVPANYDVANAYGAALAEISGTIDTVVSLREREKVLDELKTNAMEKAINSGAAREKIACVEQQIIPYAYAPNQMARVIIRYSGPR